MAGGVAYGPAPNQRLSLPIGCGRPRPCGHWLVRGRVSRARPGAMAAERGLELVRELHRAGGGHLPPFRVSAGGTGNTGMGPALADRVRCCRRRRCGRRWRRCARCTSGTRPMCELGSCSRHGTGGAPQLPSYSSFSASRRSEAKAGRTDLIFLIRFRHCCLLRNQRCLLAYL